MPEQIPASGPTEGVEVALRRVGGRVAVSPAPDYAALVAARLQSGPPPRQRPASGRRWVRALAVAAVVAVVLGVVLGVPRTRHAVAELFGIAGVQVHEGLPIGQTPRTSLERALDLGQAVTLAEARQQVSFPLGLPTSVALGSPDAIYLSRDPGLQSVSLVFRPRSGFPVTRGSHVGLLLSEYAGTATPYFDKYLAQGIKAQQVVIADRWPGLYLPGEQQVLVEGRDGATHTAAPRLSAPSLIWTEGHVTYRLEGEISRARALTIAAGVR